jgi:hypothetical protein
VIEGMPVFTIQGKDVLAVLAVEAYEDLCIENGWHEQAAEVRKAKTEIQLWQENNPDLVKRPDHPHVPVSHPPIAVASARSYTTLETLQIDRGAPDEDVLTEGLIKAEDPTWERPHDPDAPARSLG